MRYVLEGSVRKAGNRIRATAQLVEAESGNRLWAERFDRDLAEIYALQDEITQSVVGAIEPEMLASRGGGRRAKVPRATSMRSIAGCAASGISSSSPIPTSTGRRRPGFAGRLRTNSSSARGI